MEGQIRYIAMGRHWRGRWIGVKGIGETLKGDEEAAKGNVEEWMTTKRRWSATGVLKGVLKCTKRRRGSVNSFAAKLFQNMTSYCVIIWNWHFYYQICQNWGFPTIVIILYYDVIIEYGRLEDIHIFPFRLACQQGWLGAVTTTTKWITSLVM